MSKRCPRTLFGAFISLVSLAVIAVPGALATHGGDREVTVASNDGIFSQNKQNEPALAVDLGQIARGHAPNILAAGSNDNIDMEACNVGDDTTCPFTDGVGVSGIYFSFDSGDTWTQPEYTGYSARNCLGVPGTSSDTCTPEPNGPIGTLPRYFENGLVSDGDPALAFGPKPGSNGFSWANGSRLYYANLTANFGAARNGEFKGFEAIGVSRTDDVAGAAAGDKNAWMPPVIASKQAGTTFSDKEQIWADNASSSRFFGTVYICYAQFRGNGSFQNGNEPAPLTVLVSHDGGSTWNSKKLTAAATAPKNNASNGFGISGCSVRTDSNGVAYLFGERFAAPTTLPPHSQHVLFKSFDGGNSWTKPQIVQQVVDPCFFIDPVIGRCVEDGVAGARNDLAASPSVDIANGAPTGAGATNEIVDSWADGRDGQNHEHVMLSYSMDAGTSFSPPAAVETAGDRGYYAAPAISQNGRDIYVTYNAFTTPFQTTTSTPRTLVGVEKHFDVGPSGAPTPSPGPGGEIHRGVAGDPRGSSQNDLQAEFLGDYVYAIATNTYGAGVWNDARNAVDCPGLDAWRMSLEGGPAAPKPAPNVNCPQDGFEGVAFGNSDIFGGSWADPTP
jgi:hypothetical protein